MSNFLILLQFCERFLWYNKAFRVLRYSALSLFRRSYVPYAKDIKASYFVGCTCTSLPTPLIAKWYHIIFKCARLFTWLRDFYAKNRMGSATLRNHLKGLKCKTSQLFKIILEYVGGKSQFLAVDYWIGWWPHV